MLGLTIIPEFQSWAEDPNGPLMIATAKGGTKLALFAGTPQGPKPTSGFHRVAFLVNRAGFEAFLEHVKDHPVFDESGNEVREITPKNHGLALSAYFQDPYGHRLEITTYEINLT